MTAEVSQMTYEKIDRNKPNKQYRSHREAGEDTPGEYDPLEGGDREVFDAVVCPEIMIPFYAAIAEEGEIKNPQASCP